MKKTLSRLIYNKALPFLKKYILTRGAAFTLLLFICFYAAGAAVGYISNQYGSKSNNMSVAVSAEGNWGLSFQEEGCTPVGNATIQELAQYDAYYAEDTEEKVLYLTFDAGYETETQIPSWTR